MLSSVSFRLFLFRMAMHCCGVLSLFTVLLSGSLLAAPQVVSLSSGERLVGEVMPQSNDQVLVLKSNLLGEMSIQRAQIVAIEPQVIPTAKLASATNTEPQSAEVKKQVDTQVAIAEKMTEVEQALEEEQPLVDKLFAFKAPEAWHGNLRMGMNISSGDKQWTETALRGKLEIKQQGDPNFYRFTGSIPIEKQSVQMESRTSRPIAMMARLFIAVRLRVIIGLYKIQCPLVWTKSKGLTVRFKSLWELAIR